LISKKKTFKKKSTIDTIGGAPAGNELAIASPRKNLGKQ
jgi:hypothetical protein